MKFKTIVIILTVLVFASSCNDNVNEPDTGCFNNAFFSEYHNRKFRMGFTSWPFAATVQAVDSTYGFINEYADIYAEHFDYKIPWKSWINNKPLPLEFTSNVEGRLARKIPGKKFLLSISLLNNSRNDLAEDYDGSIPDYSHLNDKVIEDAYYRHVNYLIAKFAPDYLVVVIEANLLWANAPDKWNDYKLLAKNIIDRVKKSYPSLPISESFSLNSLYDIAKSGNDTVLEEMINYMNRMDFVSISFYPFMRQLHTKNEFGEMFDFLHKNITKPIAFVETSTIAEDLSVPNLNVFIEGDSCEQNAYLETLLENAQEHNYEFIIWWAFRDFDALWETFPEEVKDIGKIWRDTGLLDEKGNKRIAFYTWNSVYNKPYK